MESRDIETTAKEKLCNSGYGELKHIACHYDECGRTLTLRGNVTSFYFKQTAQEVVRGIKHIERVINLIEVRGS